jgi:hypothetical protein
MLTTTEILKKYGEPCDSKTQVIITLQYPMRLAWDKTKTVNRITVHKLIAENFKKVFSDLLSHYGLEKIQELGIDLFGGTFNCRKMRGGSSMSRHAWSIAIDLDPERNQLKETKKTARFARPEYKPMIDIFYKHGFIGYGPEKDYDWMHFEIGY